MFSKFLKNFKKQPKFQGERDYGTDILSSVQDILPQSYMKHFQNNKEPFTETFKTNQEFGILSPNPSQTNIKINFLHSVDNQEKKENDNYQYCQLSLDYFSLHNKFRQYCIIINETRLFQYLQNIMALLCIVILIIKPYNNQDSGINSNIQESQVFYILIVCDIVFSIHQIIQIICYGLWSCKQGYYRNPLALINGIALFLGVCLRQSYFYIFRILFLLDYLVQLKFFKKLRKICLSIQNAFFQILYITLILCFFLYVFSVVGVQVWTNKLDNYCVDSSFQVDFYPTRLCGTGRGCGEGYTCQLGYYEEPFVQYSHNFTSFDYVQKAMVSMFVVHFLEGWVEIEQNLSDSFNKYAGAVFLWTYIFIGSFFLQNLVIAILLKQFQQENSQEEIQQPFVQINSHTKILYSNEKRKTVFAQPNYLTRSRSRVLQMLMNSTRKNDKQKLRIILKKILASKITKYFYSTLFLGNLISLSMNDEAAYKNNLENKLAIINICFLIIYLLEDFARIYVWKQKESKIVLILESICDIISIIGQFVNLNQPFILSSVKGIRLLWLFNEQTSWSNYRVLLSALWKFFNNLPIILIILLTYGIIFGVLARNFFAGQLKFNLLGYYDLNGAYVPRANFDTLRETVTSLFVIICSDQWQTLFYNTLETGSWIPYFFFILIQYLSKFFILPSFITMMLDNYEEAKNEATLSKARAAKVISTIQNKSKVIPTKENSFQSNTFQTQTQYEKKRYFGRLTKVSDDSEKEEESSKQHSSLKRSQSKFYQLQILKSGDDQQVISLSYQQSPTNWKQYFLNSSLFILNNKSNFRKKLHQITQHRIYEQIISIIIFFNLISLGYDTPLDYEKIYLDIFNYVFGTIFIFEAFLKILSSGFFWNKLEPKKSYIFNPNNALDFILLIFCSLDDLQILQIQYFKACRALRALRILRTIRRDTQIEQLNLISQALYQTISLLSSMIFVTGVSLWILSIICMTIWKGKLFFCSQVSIKTFIDIVTKEDCLQNGGEWIDSVTNFDTIQDSLLCLFRLIIGEGWTQQMFTVSDITDRGLNPKLNASAQNQFIYYILIFLLNIVLLNLIIGLIINNYRTIKENIANFQQLNDNQKQWFQLMRIMQKKKLITLIPKPSNKYRLICYKLMNNQYFELVIFSFLIINLIFCSCYSGKQDITTQNAFYGLNIFFVIIYHIEILIKLLAYSFQFFKDNLHRIDILFLLIQDILLIMKDEFQLPRLFIIPLILRSLYILRTFKIYKINRQLRVLIDVIQELIPTLFWIVIFILFIIVVYALVGIQVFSTIWSTPQDPQYPYTIEESQRTKSFSNFFDGILLLIDITTGQYWSLYMADYTLDTKGCHTQNIQQFQTEGARGCSTIFGYFYFISFVVIIRIIITSLFLAMILESYQDCLMENTAAINPYQLEDFLLKWSDYDPQGTGWITPEDFAFLMFEINPPLGFKDENSQYYDFNSKNQKLKSHLYNHKKKMMLFKTEIFQKLSDYQVQIYQNQMIHFKDICIQLAYNAIKKKNDLQGIEQIEDKVILRQIRKSWEARYPDLVGKRGQQFAVDIFAINSITDILRGVIERRKIKKRIKEMQKEKNLKQLEMNENAYLTTRNIIERYKGRKKSQIRKRVFPFVQAQSFRKNKGVSEKLDNAFSKHRKIPSITPQIQNKKENNNQLQNLNFYIDPSEMYNGFPMKVVYETQKIDFPTNSSQKSLGNQLNSQSEQQSKKVGGYISEKCSDEENQQDSVLQNQFDNELFD